MNWTRIWFGGWWLIFLLLIVHSFDKWGMITYWIWIWFIVNTAGIWGLIYRPKLNGIRRNYTYNSLQYQLLIAHSLLLVVTYFVATFGKYSVIKNKYPALEIFHSSYAWLMPLQILFMILVIMNRRQVQTFSSTSPEDSVPKSLKEYKISWKKKIGKNQTEQVVNEIEQYLEDNVMQVDDDTRDQFILLQSDWNKTKEEIIQNRISSDQTTVKLANFNYRLINFINTLTI